MSLTPSSTHSRVAALSSSEFGTLAFFLVATRMVATHPSAATAPTAMPAAATPMKWAMTKLLPPSM